MYQAIASPAFISLDSEDPILEAFKLKKELNEEAEWEPEFQEDYNRLAGQCIE